jgi:glycosyltransferase involved in cell wall biosynthesis
MSSSSDLPLVSVVLAAYNGERFIGQQIDSILNQSYSNIELIIVDDCSTDSTSDIVNQYAEKDRRVKVFFNSQNLGYVKNFEKGLLLATGDYIAPSDQDDIWMKEKVAVLMKEIDGREIVYCNSELIDDNGNSLHKKLSDIKRLISFDNCLNYAIGGTVPGHGMIVTKQLVQRCIPFPTMIPHDYWLGFVATCRTSIKFIDIPLVQYRQHIQNVFGAVKVAEGKRKKEKLTKKESLLSIRERMRLLYEKCPPELSQKQVYKQLLKSYQSFSLVNNINRMLLFFKHRHEILAYKNRSELRKWLFCLKMFYKIK